MNSMIGKEEFALDPGDTAHLYVNALHRLSRPTEENRNSSWRHASYLLLKSCSAGLIGGFWGDLEG